MALLCQKQKKSDTEMPLSKDELLVVADRITTTMKSDDFFNRVKQLIDEKNVPPTPAILDEFERVQCSFFAEWGYEGNEVLRELKLAVKNFPENDVRQAIMKLCSAEESSLIALNNFAAEKMGVDPAAASHGHSHNGQPCHGHGAHGHGSHGHSHDHGSHGHSHNGQPCHGHGHGQPSQEQVMAMQMAMGSLSPAQKTEMARIQNKIFAGQQLTREDQASMSQIQQHLMAYMSTMQQFVRSQVAQQSHKK